MSLLRHDLDGLDEVFEGYSGPLKLQVCGPWTLAATLEKTRGDKVLADYGARRDVTESLAEGVSRHVAEVSNRLPGAQVLLQIDEPGLPAVLAGDVPTVSGFGRHHAVDAVAAHTALASVIEAVGVPVVVHCCAPDVPMHLLRRAGAAGISFDASIYPHSDEQADALAEAVEAGVLLLPGVVPTRSEPAPDTELDGAVAAHRLEVTGLWQRLDQPPDKLATSVIVTPACGLAGASVAFARTALRLARDVGRALLDEPTP
jgi:methionine synthase II (cobalamin-independent)